MSGKDRRPIAPNSRATVRVHVRGTWPWWRIVLNVHSGEPVADIRHMAAYRFSSVSTARVVRFHVTAGPAMSRRVRRIAASRTMWTYGVNAAWGGDGLVSYYWRVGRRDRHALLLKVERSHDMRMGPVGRPDPASRLMRRPRLTVRVAPRPHGASATDQGAILRNHMYGGCLPSLRPGQRAAVGSPKGRLT